MAIPAALLRALNAPPALGIYSAARSIPYTDAFGPGVGPGNQLVMKDEQGLRQAMQAWEEAGAGQGGGYAGLVIGDTPGQTQGNLLNLRAQDIRVAMEQAQMAQQERLRQDALRQAAYDRAEGRAIRRDDLARLYKAQALQDAQYRDRTRMQYLADLAKIEADQALARGKALGVEQAQRSLEPFYGYDRRIAEAEMSNEEALARLLGNVSQRASAYPGNILMQLDADGALRFTDPSKVATAQDYRNAEGYVWGEGPGSFRDQYNNLLAEQTRLAGGRAAFESDLAAAYDRAKAMPPVQVDTPFLRELLSQRSQVQRPAPQPTVLDVLRQRALRPATTWGNPQRPVKRWRLDGENIR